MNDAANEEAKEEEESDNILKAAAKADSRAASRASGQSTRFRGDADPSALSLLRAAATHVCRDANDQILLCADSVS